MMKQRIFRAVLACALLLPAAGRADPITITIPDLAHLPQKGTVSYGIGPDGNLHLITTDNTGKLNGGSGGTGGTTGGAVTGAAGSFVDGWDATEGTTNDTAWSGTGPATNNALLKALYSRDISGLLVNQGTSPWVVSGSVSVSNFPATQAISATSLPLPTGAATSALQQTTISTLGSPFQANGSIGNTTFASTQSGPWAVGLNAGINSIGSVTDQGAVSTNGPTYTTGTTQSISLTTGGALRTADVNLGLAQGSTTSGQLGPIIMATVQALNYNPGFTVGQDQTLVMTPSGALRTAMVGAANNPATYSSGSVGGVASSVISPVAIADYNPSVTPLTTGQSAAPQENTMAALVTDQEGLKVSYSAATAVFTPYATPTDVLCIGGSATKTVRVREIKVTTSVGSGTAGTMPLQLIKRSSADTPGTSTAITETPNDSGNAAATGTVTLYTNAPGTGTNVGSIDSAILGFQVQANSPAYIRAFGGIGEQSIVLRGTTQSLCVNFAAAAVPTGATATISARLTEE